MSVDKGRKEEEKGAASLHGDLLEEIISHVPSLDLVPSSHVSSSWRRAVRSHLAGHPRCRAPWLVLHLQSRRRPEPSAALARAYDPRSRVWIPLPPPPRTCGGGPLCSPHPGLLLALSPSALALSAHPLAATWRRLAPPRAPRDDAAFAIAAGRLVAAGGTCELYGSDDRLAVESCDLDTGHWEPCEPMPEQFRESASAMWLSVAVSDREAYFLEKRTGWLGRFDPCSNRWGPTRRVWSDRRVFLSAVGYGAGGKVMVVEAVGEAVAVESVTVWGLDLETMRKEEMGQMPTEMMERMVGDGWGLSSSIGFSVVGDFGYFYNPSDLGDIFLCEFSGGRCCQWASVGVPDVVKQHPMHSVVFGCSIVGIEDLKSVYCSPDDGGA